jgi:hypothetical protein
VSSSELAVALHAEARRRTWLHTVQHAGRALARIKTTRWHLVIRDEDRECIPHVAATFDAGARLSASTESPAAVRSVAGQCG